MEESKTTILPIEDVCHRLDCFINQNNVGTIFPENFFTSIRHYLDLGTQMATWHLGDGDECGEIAREFLNAKK